MQASRDKFGPDNHDAEEHVPLDLILYVFLRGYNKHHVSETQLFERLLHAQHARVRWAQEVGYA